MTSWHNSCPNDIWLKKKKKERKGKKINAKCIVLYHHCTAPFFCKGSDVLVTDVTNANIKQEKTPALTSLLRYCFLKSNFSTDVWV